jgi:hypothetical protein
MSARTSGILEAMQETAVGKAVAVVDAVVEYLTPAKKKASRL